MAQEFKALNGPAARAYLRALLAGEPGLPPEIADRLEAALAREIVQLRVRRPLAVRRGRTAATGRTQAAQPSAQIAAAAAAASAQPPPSPPAFDPYAFSLIVVLRREGEDALAQRLARIEAAADLVALATAQHIAMPAEAKSLEALRAAIIAGTRERLADRLAAAS